MSEADDLLGRKLFFLHPSAVVRNRVVEELTQQEFEVYLVTDALQQKKMLKKYSGSIVFACIQEKMTEKEWEKWIVDVIKDPATKNTDIGIICTGASDNDALREKYIKQIGIKCGFTVIKSDLSIAMRELYEILKAADAKGRRKYIRATMESDANAKVNLNVNGEYVNGSIKDISVVGFSCVLKSGTEINKNTLFPDIQIKLGAIILKAEGIVFGSRMEGEEKAYVIIFTQRIDPEVRTKIRKYIQSNLQAKLDAEM